MSNRYIQGLFLVVTAENFKRFRDNVFRLARRFDSCFDDADRSCKNQIDARAIVARATLKKLARNLLNISGVAAINKP